MVMIPSVWWKYYRNTYVGDKNNIINEVYGNISENILSDNILDSVILEPKNYDCTLINTDIFNQIPGEQGT